MIYHNYKIYDNDGIRSIYSSIVVENNGYLGILTNYIADPYSFVGIMYTNDVKS